MNRTYIMLVLVCLMFLLPYTEAAEFLHKSSFEETYNRYPSPYAIIEQFKKIVPIQGTEAASCLVMDENAAPVSGVIDPLQNGALEEQPGAMFYHYYQECVRSLVKSGFKSHSSGNVQIIIGESLKLKIEDEVRSFCLQNIVPMCYQPGLVGGQFNWSNLSWGLLPEINKKELIQRMIAYLIGPEIILRAKGYIGEKAKFAQPVPNIEALAQLLHDFTISLDADKTLSFSDVYAEIAIILRLGPAIKA